MKIYINEKSDSLTEAGQDSRRVNFLYEDQWGSSSASVSHIPDSGETSAGSMTGVILSGI